MQVIFIGWCKVGNHDKVWGIGKQGPDKFATFWGRRGKKLRTKVMDISSYEAWRLIHSKIKKGYVPVDKDNLEKVYERFAKDLFVISLSM